MRLGKTQMLANAKRGLSCESANDKSFSFDAEKENRNIQ